MANDNRKIDESTEAMLYEGASLSQINKLFRMDQRDIKEKIASVKPSGKRSGFPVYHIRDVAPYLVQPPYDMDEFISRMNIADLPTILRKEYWAGMRSQQIFMQQAGELWATADVVEAITDLFRTIRLSLLLTRESVERETDLTEKQRAIITKIIDNALEEANAATIRKFSDHRNNSSEPRVEADGDSEEL